MRKEEGGGGFNPAVDSLRGVLVNSYLSQLVP